ncbi:MAG: tyrosine-protein kinase domain-containing protein [Mycobacteriales bacterium]
MTLRDYGRVLRKRWRLLAACILLAVGGAAAAIVLTTPTYSASVQLFVSTPIQGVDLANAYSGSQFTQQQVTSYADVVGTPTVTAPVIAQLHLPFTANQLAKKISATVPLNTVLIDIAVSDTNPGRAAAIANAVAAQFVTVVDQLETPTTGGKSPVRVSVVQGATTPTAPVSPKKTLDLALGLLVGLALGVGGAVLRETLDTSVKTPEELTELAGAPTVGVISYDTDAPTHPLILHAGPGTARAEAYRQLRTNLQFIDVDARPRSIVVTSSLPGEGKTTSTCNLAIALAQGGARVVLVDADLRNPGVAGYLGLEGAVGLTSVLVGQVSLDIAVQRWGNQLFDVLPSGPVPPNPSELLGSRQMTGLLRTLEGRYDLVLVDAPPLLPVTDAAVLATLTSGAVFLVRQGHTRREQVVRAVASLTAVDARLLGGVLNMAPAKESAYAYGYGYRYQSQPEGGSHRRTSDQTPRPAAPSLSPAATLLPTPVNGTQPEGVRALTSLRAGRRPSLWRH